MTLSTVDRNFLLWYDFHSKKGGKETTMGKSKGLEQFRLPRWEELPSIDLYLDQVLSLLEEWL